MNIFHCIWKVLALCCVFGASELYAANITDNTNGFSTSGTFTLSWPASDAQYFYRLHIANGSWVPTQQQGSATFENLPSGTYGFELYACFTWCFTDSNSYHEVLVERDTPVGITSTNEAGSVPYTTEVSLRGQARINIPLRVVPGVNGMAPNLALQYDSANLSDVVAIHGIRDTLTYGWYVTGESRITRCRIGLSNAFLQFDNTDLLCLDDEPLVAVSGSYWATGTQYRTASQSFIKVVDSGGNGSVSRYFTVYYPDGRIATFGDTADSQVIASGRENATWWVFSPNETYNWSIRQVTHPLGGSMTYSYDRIDMYGMLLLKQIDYNGASVEFKYGPVADASVNAGTANGTTWSTWRSSILHTIVMKNAGIPVREYRLDIKSDNQTPTSHVRLEAVQECGYDEWNENWTINDYTCLPPLSIGWQNAAEGSVPIVVNSLTDGLGAVTEFDYIPVTPTSTHDATYGTSPFGNTITPSGMSAQTVMVVSAFKQSDGLTTTGRQVTDYLYRGKAWGTTTNNQFAGFYEVRAHDQQTGVYTYTQTRLDNVFKGSISQVRSFDAQYTGSGDKNLTRQEFAFGTKSVQSGVTYGYPLRVASWVYENGVLVGASQEVNTPCFRTLSGDTCPGSGSESEFVTQMSTSTTTGTSISNPSYTPSVWGDVPIRIISGIQHTTTGFTNYQNTTSPSWTAGAVVKTSTTEQTTGKPALTVVHRNTIISGTTIPSVQYRYDNDTTVKVTHTPTYTVNNGISQLTDVTDSGAGISPNIKTTFGAAYDDDRYVPYRVDWKTYSSAGLRYDYQYDKRFGAVKKTTFRGLVSGSTGATDSDSTDNREYNVTYDNFGRLISRTQPDGTAITHTYERCDLLSDCTAVNGGNVDAKAVPAIRIMTEIKNGSTHVAPKRYTWLDVRGREVLTQVWALDAVGGFHRKRTVYNERGLLKYTTKPYFTGGGMPTCSAAGSNCTWYEYDVLGRVTREDRPDGGYAQTAYSGSTGSASVVITETVENPDTTTDTREKRSLFNVLGRLTQTTDAYNTSSSVNTDYDYDSHGNLTSVKINNITLATMSYNLADHRTQIIESNSGTTAMTVDALGRLLTVTDAKSQVTQYTWDALSRQTQRIDGYGSGSPVTNTWTWDATNAAGALESRTNGQFTETWTYGSGTSGPSSGKPTSVTTAINISGVMNDSFAKSFTYDTQGRLQQITYPQLSAAYGGGTAYDAPLVTHIYSARGFETQIKNGTVVLEETADTDVFGNVTQTKFNNDVLRTNRTYDADSGRLLTIQTGLSTESTPKTVQELEYKWRSNGTLWSRIDYKGNGVGANDVTDTYTYDSMERVTQQATTGSATRTLGFNYDNITGNFNASGRTSSVSGDLNVTNYTYANASTQPHRLTSVTIGGVINNLSYDANGNITLYNANSGDDTWLDYDQRNNVTKITVGDSQTTAEPTARDEFWYDPDGQRYLRRATWTVSAGVVDSAVTVYMGDFEFSTTCTHSGGNCVTDSWQRIQFSAAVRWWRKIDGASGNAESNGWLFTHGDHLGSVDVVTDSSGTRQGYEMSYDPFGGRRTRTWAQDVSSNLTPSQYNAIMNNEQKFTNRGFTGHEQLNHTGFIHMNGRVYDPRIGRFVSPDPIVSDPTFSQSYNRYAYVTNSPLSYTDPSGYSIFGKIWKGIKKIAKGVSKVRHVVKHAYMCFYGGGEAGSGGGRAGGCAALVGDIRDLSSGGGHSGSGTHPRGGTVNQGEGGFNPENNPYIMQLENGQQSGGFADGAITKDQYELAKSGRYIDFWKSRWLNDRDPVARTALIGWGYGGLVGAKDWEENAAEATWRLLDVYIHSRNLHTSMEKIGADLALEHARAVILDGKKNISIPNLLSPKQVADYHWNVFQTHKIPRGVFGGTIFGLPPETYSERWCAGCDTDP